MVELSRGAATAVVVGGAVAVLLLAGLLAASVRRWRGASRRLAAVASRLDAPGGPPPDDRDVVGRVERLAQGAVLRLSEGDARAERLAGALGAVGTAVVVCDESGTVVHDGTGGLADRAGATADTASATADTATASATADRASASATADTASATADRGIATAGVAEAVRAVLAAGVDGRADERTVDVAGPPRRSLRVRGGPVDDGRRIVGAVAVVDDITEQRRFDAVRRDFLANLTAELKAPLGALGLLAGTILAEDDPALTRRLAGRLEADALRVGRLVDDLAELSRLEAQALPAREPVSVHLLVAQAVERAAATAPGRAVSVDASAVGPDAAVVGDRRQLVAALAHLVENAVRAGGDVRVAVAAAAAGGLIDVTVSDGGPGIPPDELDRVFEAFYRTGAARERSPAGSGLGLAIASRVAAAAGGEVLVTSEVGRGSTFTLRLPAAERPGVAEREAG